MSSFNGEFARIPMFLMIKLPNSCCEDQYAPQPKHFEQPTSILDWGLDPEKFRN